MKRKLIGILSFAATVAVLVGTLKLVNWLPTAIDDASMRRYTSIEEAKDKLGIKDIYVPSFFPQTLEWPPAEVLAQKRPFEAMVMAFRRAGGEGTAMVVTQAERADFAYDAGVGFDEVNERVPYDLKGRKALLEAGLCRDGSPCSRLTWEEGGITLKITIKSQPPELLRIAESMLP